MQVPTFVPSSLAIAIVAITVALAARALADGPPAPQAPPPEAFTACESKAAGDACTVLLRDREVHGSCARERDGQRLFCLPTDLPPPPPDGPRPPDDGR
jgi:hypothetical protein